MCCLPLFQSNCLRKQRQKDKKGGKGAAAGDKPEEPIPMVDEKPIKYSETDPKNQSGCQIQ